MGSWTNAAKYDALNTIAGSGLKMALYDAGAAVSATTAAYTATGEVTDGSNIPAGGFTLTNKTITASDGSVSTAGVDFDDPTFTPSTQKSFQKVIIYDPARSNRTVYFHDYGTPQVANAGTAYTVKIPATGSYLLTLA